MSLTGFSAIENTVYVRTHPVCVCVCARAHVYERSTVSELDSAHVPVLPAVLELFPYSFQLTNILLYESEVRVVYFYSKRI